VTWFALVFMISTHGQPPHMDRLSGFDRAACERAARQVQLAPFNATDAHCIPDEILVYSGPKERSNANPIKR
jgi:hypothetical protein